MERLKGNLIPEDEQQELDTKGTIFALSQGVDVFQAILNHPQLSESFTDYITTQWCVENILFYRAVETYREQCKEVNADIRQLAQRVAREYVMNGAILEVNLDFGVKKTVLREVEEAPSASTFDEAQRAIYKLMETDSFAQWQRTGQFKKALQEVVDHSSTGRDSRSRRDTTGQETPSHLRLRGSAPLSEGSIELS